MEWRLLGAALLLCLLNVLHALMVNEKDDVFERTACPAFLMFDNAAYLAGMTFELPCKCKPEEVSSVTWYFQRNVDSPKVQVLTDFAGTVLIDSSHVRTGSNVLKRFSIRLFSLIVFRAQVRDSGHYLCGTKEGDFFYGYDVDIQPSQRIVVAFLDRGQHVQENYTEKDFSLFTAFWDWTRCDRCGVRGEQRRIGLCYMQSAQLDPRYRTGLPNITSCGSRAVPAPLQHASRLRAPEVAIRSCQSRCLTKEVAKAGLQAIANIISKVGQKPWQPPVPTQFHRQSTGSDLVITCPGARPEHAVAWDKDFTRLYRSHYLVGVNKSMRVFIDHGNHLHIQQLRGSDRGTYFCWREGKMVAGFRLIVFRQPQRRRTLIDPETIFAIKVIGMSYTIIGIIFLAINVGRCWWWVLQPPAKGPVQPV